MEKGFTVNEIASLLKVSHTTIYRKVKHLKNTLKPYQYKKGQIIYFTQAGFELIKESVISSNPNAEAVCNPVEHVEQGLTPDNNLLSILKEQLEKSERIIAEKEVQIRNYQNLINQKESFLNDIQFATIEERKRTDTIIMSLSNRLEEIQKRLPALPAPEEKKPGVLKRFLSWFTAPDQKPVDWEQTELFRKVN